MYRVFCFLILAITAFGLSAQVEADSVDFVPEASMQDLQIQKVVARAWLRANRIGEMNDSTELSEGQIVSLRQQVEALREEVWNLPLSSGNPDFLYDTRLPLVTPGIVADTTTLHLSDYMNAQFETDGQPDGFLHVFEHHYDEQQIMERERLLPRFYYGTADLRRYRFARRKFEVPTQGSQIISTQNNVLNTRLIDDADLDLGDATLENFGQTIVLKADKWHWKGDHTLQLQQTALSDNWYKGGENNMAVSSQQKLNINRYDENGKTTFDLIMDLKLSAYYTQADTVHAMKVSDNLFSLDMKYGYKAWKKWYYSAQIYAKTPVFDQYVSNNPVTKATFLAPLEVNVSLGLDLKHATKDKRFTYSLMLAPLSYNMKYVRGDRVDATSYGIDEGKHSLHEFGSTLTSKLDWKMGKNVSWSSRLYCFTSYSSMLVEFENTFNFSISRFFSARIYAYPRFDDSRDNRVQVKEMLTFGFSYQW